MSAYAALISLNQIIDHPLFRWGDRSVRGQARVHRLVDYLLNVLHRNRATQIPELEKKITEAAYKSVDFIENQTESMFSVVYNNNKTEICFLFPLVCIALLGAYYITGYEEYRRLMPVRLPMPVRFTVLIFILTIPCFIYIFVYKEVNKCVEGVMLRFDEILVRVSVARQTKMGHDPARAALNALLSKVDSILSSRRRRRLISQPERAYLESLREMGSSLQGLIENASPDMTGLQLQAIRDAAYEARKALLHYPFGVISVRLMLASYYAMLEWFFNLFVPDLLTMMIGLFNLPQEILVCCVFLVQFFIDFIMLICFVGEQITYLLQKRYSESKLVELSQLIDDFRMVVRDVTQNKDVFGSQSELPVAASKPVLGGRSRAHVVVGLDNDLKEFRHMLQDFTKREIVSIVGMGGIGKTTLASLVYNDPSIHSRFDIRAWVKVSQVYSERHVLLSLLDSAKMLTQEMQEHNDEALRRDLRRIMWRKRYLIVMDDVWGTGIRDLMSEVFPENNNGSCVLLTSRLSNLASYLDSGSHLHQMQCLNEDDSWCLLRKMVFGEDSCPFILESIGREIVRGCRGLPLAISVVGGLIYEDNGIEIWREVAEELKHSESREINEQCLAILDLSYKFLPHHLRPCFLYMGVFSGNGEIFISRLINLWVAEGFLRPHPSKNMEELGEQNLEALIDRNLILVGKRSCNGKIKTCSIHDLLKDVCVQNAKEENFFHVIESRGYGTLGRPDETTRRLSFHPDALHIDARNDFVSSYHSLRSLLCIASKPITERKIDVYLDFMYLRVLDVLEVHFDEFPHQFIKLLFLRYLAFHYDGPFPASISKLKNLETIVHHHCLFEKYPLYPMVIWSMPNLRHLYVKPGNDLSQFLWGLSFLVNLQTLAGARNLKWSQSVVRRIKNLKKLVISYDASSSMNLSQYQLECLVELEQLESLKLTMESTISDDPPKLAFPQKLKKLSLSGCGIPWAEMAGIGALLNLEVLKLRHDAFCGPSWETMEEKFPQLTFLLLEEMCFASWETEAAHFPCLQHLVMKSCGALEEFPYCFGDIPTLKMIQLINCHPSAVDSAREMLQEQDDSGNEELKLHVLNW